MDLLGDFCHLTDLNPDFILSPLPVSDTDTLKSYVGGTWSCSDHLKQTINHDYPIVQWALAGSKQIWGIESERAMASSMEI